jgi:hypothetical protein
MTDRLGTVENHTFLYFASGEGRSASVLKKRSSSLGSSSVRAPYFFALRSPRAIARSSVAREIPSNLAASFRVSAADDMATHFRKAD